MSADPSPLPEAWDDAASRDLAWMEQVKQGDLNAFQALVEAHQHRVIGTAAKMLGDDAEAEDVAQQVFIRVWKSAPRYEPTAKFTTWLFKITRNLVLNELRRRGRHRLDSLDRPDEAGGVPVAHPDLSAKSPDTSMLDEEMQNAIQRAIDSLPETQRLAIVLRRYDEFSYEEIADIMGLTVPAVKSVIFRARTELKTRLKQYLEG